MFKEKIINALENLKRVYKTDRKIWCKIYWYDRFYFRDSFNDHDKRQNMIIKFYSMFGKTTKYNKFLSKK
jgi:hypothetical protein